jgi:hypothetical protein
MLSRAAKCTLMSMALTTCSGNPNIAKIGSSPPLIFRVDPAPFFPGTPVAAHVGLTESYPTNFKFPCIDPNNPTGPSVFDSSPIYELILVQILPDGSTADLQTAPKSVLPYSPPVKGGWRRFDMPPVQTPAGLNWNQLRAIFAYAQTKAASGAGGACKPDVEVTVIRSHDFKRLCVSGSGVAQCRYVLKDGFNG